MKGMKQVDLMLVAVKFQVQAECPSTSSAFCFTVQLFLLLDITSSLKSLLTRAVWAL